MSTTELAATPNDLRSLAEQSNAWPFEQAKAIVARLKKSPKDEVLFETGYGPSGLPHIGTFGEVARTTMVRHAFRVLTEDKIKTRLLASAAGSMRVIGPRNSAPGSASKLSVKGCPTRKRVTRSAGTAPGAGGVARAAVPPGSAQTADGTATLWRGNRPARSRTSASPSSAA